MSGKVPLAVVAAWLSFQICAIKADQACAGDEIDFMQLQRKLQLAANATTTGRNRKKEGTAGILLNSAPFLYSHNAGTGLGMSGCLGKGEERACNPGGHDPYTQPSDTQTQQGSLADQLNCGARALDLKLAQYDGKVIFHHDWATSMGEINLPGKMNFTSSMVDVISWASQHPDELVMLIFNHCMNFNKSTSEVIDCYAPFFANKVQELGINIVPGLGGPTCHSGTGTGMTLEAAKKAATLPGGGMLLAVFDDSNSSTCTNEHYDDSVTWGETMTWKRYNQCPYLGTENNESAPWTNLWKYLQRCFGTDPQGKLHESQALWQATSNAAYFIITNEEHSMINEAVYKQIESGFLPTSELNLLKMNSICHWGPEISISLGASVSPADRGKCDAAFSRPDPGWQCHQSSVCSGLFDESCCRVCHCATSPAGTPPKCTIPGRPSVTTVMAPAPFVTIVHHMEEPVRSTHSICGLILMKVEP
ncbi:unnamed protein product [Polarella glacialis]|uniref:PLC-like phosphodiesterase n=1 Tax=Polarella glacialis TaxID=89957 RepID=A0A813EQ12_POLGL|nr:unnamed protein product [Polarella glacialis]